jgi:hypothetical protein
LRSAVTKGSFFTGVCAFSPCSLCICIHIIKLGARVINKSQVSETCAITILQACLNYTC